MHSRGHFPARTPCSQALVSGFHLSPTDPPKCDWAETRGGGNHTHKHGIHTHTHTHSLFSQAQLAKIPPHMNTQRKRMAEGRGWLDLQLPGLLSLQLCHEKRKRQQRRKERKKRKGKEREAMLHPYPLLSVLTLSVCLSPLPTQTHFPRASFPLKHTSLLPALLEPGLRSHIPRNRKKKSTE